MNQRRRTQQILEHFIKEENFEWGKRDCCLWTADILKAIHGVDFAKPFRGTYSSRKGFAKLLIKSKVKNLEELLLEVFPMEPQPAGLAFSGDPVLLEEQGESLLGVCYGTYALFLTETGLTRRSLDHCKCSWSI